jgi:uncharacterized protein
LILYHFTYNLYLPVMLRKYNAFPFVVSSMLFLLLHLTASAQTDSTPSAAGFDPLSQDPVIKDSIYPGTRLVKVRSGNSELKMLQYYPTGKGPHPTLILLHGYTGMPGNVDVAAALSRAGWNVMFFRYRGSWGMPGEFAFQNCVEDAVSMVNYCKVHAKSLNVDTNQIALFGHSMGGWVALKAAMQLPVVNKVFLLSTWDIYKSVANAKVRGTLNDFYKEANAFAELKLRSGELLYQPVLQDSAAFQLLVNGPKVNGKKICFLDEHEGNKALVDYFKKHTSVQYDIWKSDHSFTYTRVAMLRYLMTFLSE